MGGWRRRGEGRRTDLSQWNVTTAVLEALDILRSGGSEADRGNMADTSPNITAESTCSHLCCGGMQDTAHKGRKWLMIADTHRYKYRAVKDAYR